MSEDSRDIFWIPWTGPGCEHLHLSLSPDGPRALGLILGLGDAGPFRCRYELEADRAWRFRKLSLALTGSGHSPPRRLTLEGDGQGRWHRDGELAADLEGCVDIDIQVTPFTNSLPIRRLDLDAGAQAELTVVYVPVPELDPRPVAQRYTCVRPLSERGGTYCYEGLFREFVADLPVDGDGSVLDYPETFKRSWPT